MGHLTELLREASALQGRTLCGRWRVERLLGGGASAAVFEATHQRNGKRAALKVLHPELASNSRLKARFLREGYLANRVGHPGAVSVLDDDETEDGILFLVMEFLEGQTVGQWARQQGGRLPVPAVIRVADGILDVLQAAHTKQIVHRDIKPDNVFFTTAGDVRVLDFGLARWMEDTGALLTRSEASLGTPAFMAPEQARGERHAMDHRSDLWSVGATLYSLLSGKFVHDSNDQGQLVFSAALESAPSLAHVMPEMPAALVAVVDRALKFDKRARFQSASEMRAALRRVLDATAHVETRALSSAVTGDHDTLTTAPENDAGPLRPSPPRGLTSPRVEPRKVFGLVLVGALAFAVMAASPFRRAGQAFVRTESAPAVVVKPAVPAPTLAPTPSSALEVPAAILSSRVHTSVGELAMRGSTQATAAHSAAHATHQRVAPVRAPAPAVPAARIEDESDGVGELSDGLLDQQK